MFRGLSVKHLDSGASYCAVGYNIDSPVPSEENPLGVMFPGRTFAEDGERGGASYGKSTLPNWVGHLVTMRKEDGFPLLVYDYAVGGHTVREVRWQVQKQFLPLAGKRPAWAPWNAEETLFSAFLSLECGGLLSNVLFLQLRGSASTTARE